MGAGKHRSLKNRIVLENYYLPGELQRQSEDFLSYYNTKRYHERVNNLTPEYVWLGRGNAILKHRQKIKEETIKLRKELHHQKLAINVNPTSHKRGLIICR